ncbi:hypothetical protein [Paenibacillus illinoisensis]|uniref:HTH LytTR-type domain-containing protein n=1 Tax=Paenibacillus illinoisensis TaxID=59845 RepID=A0A2W0CDV2_9BACL|nr:hypothetical protein [Paenibacillus illinoisensis]PYY28282.1 Uncharacterized protein PIL02S_03433 [Paenibacillus illinoisensis]
MDQIIVLRREGKKIHDEAEWLDVDEVNFCTRERIGREYKVVIHTDKGEYIYSNSNDAFFALMGQRNGMIMTDKGMLGNIYKMESVDYEDGKVYFNEEENEYITISTPKKNIVKEYIAKLLKK